MAKKSKGGVVVMLTPEQRKAQVRTFEYVVDTLGDMLVDYEATETNARMDVEQARQNLDEKTATLAKEVAAADDIRANLAEAKRMLALLSKE